MALALVLRILAEVIQALKDVYQIICNNKNTAEVSPEVHETET